jgi:hypothetical protein
MSRFNPWEMHHFYVGLVSGAIGGVLLFAWYLGERSPWHGGYGVTLCLFGAWMVADDLYQHWRQSMVAEYTCLRCGKIKRGRAGGVAYLCDPPCFGTALNTTDKTYHSWVHKRYNKDVARWGVGLTLVVYCGRLFAAGLVATWVFAIAHAHGA